MSFINIISILASLAIIISAVCLLLLLQIRRRLNSFTSSKDDKSIDQVLAEFIVQSRSTKHEQEQIKKILSSHEEQFMNHFQHIGIVRFNPFSDTGGDQSFTLALLDGHQNGFVISSLHARDQTRFFAKPITNGKGSLFGLSKEEKRAIDQAVKK